MGVYGPVRFSTSFLWFLLFFPVLLLLYFLFPSCSPFSLFFRLFPVLLHRFVFISGIDFLCSKSSIPIHLILLFLLRSRIIVLILCFPFLLFTLLLSSLSSFSFLWISLFFSHPRLDIVSLKPLANFQLSQRSGHLTLIFIKMSSLIYHVEFNI